MISKPKSSLENQRKVLKANASITRYTNTTQDIQAQRKLSKFFPKDGSFEQHRKRLKKFYCKIYQLPINSNLGVSDQIQHLSLFCTSGLKKSQIAQTIRHSCKVFVS